MVTNAAEVYRAARHGPRADGGTALEPKGEATAPIIDCAAEQGLCDVTVRPSPARRRTPMRNHAAVRR